MDCRKKLHYITVAHLFCVGVHLRPGHAVEDEDELDGDAQHDAVLQRPERTRQERAHRAEQVGF